MESKREERNRISNDLINVPSSFPSCVIYIYISEQQEKRREGKGMAKNLLILIRQTGTRNGQTNKQEALPSVTKRRALSDFQKYTLAHKYIVDVVRGSIRISNVDEGMMKDLKISNNFLFAQFDFAS